jgi:CBS-domain-containing membrane protein
MLEEEAAHGRSLFAFMGDSTTPESITQTTRIGDADRVLRMEPVVVHAGDALHRVAELAVDQPGCRVISVVDAEDRLIGVVPVRVLVNDIFLKIVPEEFLGEIVDYEAALRYARHVGARTAADVMLEPASVTVDNTVRDAFERMHAAKLNGIPIVDAERRVVGYIDQLELLLVWVRASGRGRLLQPPQRGSETER